MGKRKRRKASITFPFLGKTHSAQFIPPKQRLFAKILFSCCSGIGHPNHNRAYANILGMEKVLCHKGANPAKKAGQTKSKPARTKFGAKIKTKFSFLPAIHGRHFSCKLSKTRPILFSAGFFLTLKQSTETPLSFHFPPVRQYG